MVKLVVVFGRRPEGRQPAPSEKRCSPCCLLLPCCSQSSQRFIAPSVSSSEGDDMVGWSFEINLGMGGWDNKSKRRDDYALLTKARHINKNNPNNPFKTTPQPEFLEEYQKLLSCWRTCFMGRKRKCLRNSCLNVGVICFTSFMCCWCFLFVWQKKMS